MLINVLGNVYNVCVVPENSRTSPQRATEILRGGGGPKDGDFQGGGDAYSGFSSSGSE